MTEWVIMCNTQQYDVKDAFAELKKIDWKQSTNVEVGDIVYIYVGKPVGAIKYKCKTNKVELADADIDDSKFVIDGSINESYGRYMELELLEEYSDTALIREDLMNNGLKTLRGPSRVNDELNAFIKKASQKISYKDQRRAFQDTNTADDAEMESLIISRNDVVMDNLVKQFMKNMQVHLKKEKKLEAIRQKFIYDYKMQKLINMKKEEYVVGLGRKDTFCYRLETKLMELGDIHGSTSVKFGMYYGKSGEDKKEKYRTVKSKFGEDPDQAFEKIKEQIVTLRIAGENKDYAAIRECTLAPVFRGKLLATFYPDDYLCIFADEHLEYFLSKLGIEYTADDDILDKQHKLMAWKNSNNIMKNWSTHLFSKFLYSSFGRPFKIDKDVKDIQSAMDKNYPRDYVSNVGITIEQWKELLQNPKVFTEYDINLIKRIYMEDNHAATCYDLGVQDGVSPSSYIRPVVALAKRISETVGLPPIYGDEGKQTWWRIPFWGSYREDGHFEWKVRPKLAKALIALDPELNLMEVNQTEDNELVDELKQANLDNAQDDFQYNGKAKKKQVPKYTNGHKTYPRDRQTALNALAHAHYECEVGIDHPSFIRKKSDKKYTEPHHLVPMAFSDSFDVSLDVEENIVSLCSNCHNQIHYGQDSEQLLKQLYEARKGDLKRVGIDITVEQLLSMYGIH